MFRQLMLCLGLSLLLVNSGRGDETTEQVRKSLHGFWGVVKSEASGQPVELAWTWSFKPDGKATVIDRKAGKQSLYRYTVDAASQPHRIKIEYLGPDASLRGFEQLGIFRLAENRLTLCLNPPESSEYPTAFATKPGQGFLVEMEFMPTE